MKQILWLGALWVLASLSACSSLTVSPAADGGLSWQGHSQVPATVQETLIAAPECCTSMQSLPFKDLLTSSTFDLRLGLDAPAHSFDSGKSFFAAYRIDQLPRPALITLESYRSAAPGSILQTLLPDTRQTVFQPTLLVLNERFELLRRINADTSREACRFNVTEPAYSLSAVVTESAAQAAYLIVTSSSQAMHSDGQTVCGVLRHGMSPVGDLSLRARVIVVDDPAVQLLLPVKWYAGARSRDDVGLWQFMSAMPRVLALGAKGLQVLDDDAGQHPPHLNMAFERMLRARVSPSTGAPGTFLDLGVLAETGASDSAVTHHGFEAIDPTDAGLPRLDQFAALLQGRITPARVKQRIKWRVSPEDPHLQVGPDEPPDRIAQAAATGGLIAAWPCGLCQTVACTPDLLGACAALYGAGALIGGLTGTIQQAFAGPAAPPGDTTGTPVAALKESVQGGLTASNLATCLRLELAEHDDVVWHDQGLSAVSQWQDTGASVAGAATKPAPPPDTGEDYIAQVAMTRLQWLPDDPPQLDTQLTGWHLQLEARLTLTERVSGKVVERVTHWRSETNRAEEWLTRASALLSDIQALGCQSLARQLLLEAQQAWLVL